MPGPESHQARLVTSDATGLGMKPEFAVLGAPLASNGKDTE